MLGVVNNFADTMYGINELSHVDVASCLSMMSFVLAKGLSRLVSQPVDDTPARQKCKKRPQRGINGKYDRRPAYINSLRHDANAST